MILEHEALARWGVAAELRALRLEVIEAHTVDEAISVLESGAEVDLVFCDMDIPGALSGFGLEDWLTRNEPHIPVLLTSIDAQSVPPFNDRRGRAFLAKPFTIDAVLNRIESMILLHQNENSAQ